MFEYINKLTSVDDFKEIKSRAEKCVFVFSASWCPDCVIIDNFLEELINNYSDITFTYIDREQFPEIFETLEVYGIPSFISYVDGVEQSRFVSKFRKTREEIESFLNDIK